jgi:hypothetical protein
MKKLLAIAALGAIAATSALAQGTLTFANFGGGNNYPVMLPGGGAAGAADGVLVDLYYGTASDSLQSLGLQVNIQGNGLFTASATGNQNPVSLPSIAPGSAAFVQMVAWQGGPSYAGATISKAASPVWNIAALGGGTIPTPNIPMGAGSLQLVNVIPEPSSIALAALGLGGLLFLRRRK